MWKTVATIRRMLFVLLALALPLFSPGRANALYMEWREIERPVDWRVSVGQHSVGIAEEVHVRKWFLNEHDGREIQSVGTAIHYGFGTFTVPCRLVVFVTAVVGSIFAVVVLSMLPSLRRRWAMNHEVV